MNASQWLAELIDGGRIALADWLAVPMDSRQAQQGLASVQERLRRGCQDDAQRFTLALADMICRYWAGGDIEVTYANLAATLPDQRRRALLELCYGQLLMARRCRQAWLHLDRGFQLAAHLLDPEDYFRVLARHSLLRHLPLSSQPVDPAPLDTLLDEARVIARLTGPRRQIPDGDGKHKDTLG